MFTWNKDSWSKISLQSWYWNWIPLRCLDRNLILAQEYTQPHFFRIWDLSFPLQWSLQPIYLPVVQYWIESSIDLIALRNILLLLTCVYSSYNTNVFSSKRERTYEMLLQDMYDQYILAPLDETKGMGGYSGAGDISASQMMGTSGFRKKEVDTKMVRNLKCHLLVHAQKLSKRHSLILTLMAPGASSIHNLSAAQTPSPESIEVSPKNSCRVGCSVLCRLCHWIRSSLLKVDSSRHVTVVYKFECLTQ